MIPRHMRYGLGLATMLLAVCAAGAGIEPEADAVTPPRPAGVPPTGPGDRRSDLAWLRTLLVGAGRALSASEQIEWQAQLDRLLADESAELDSRRRAKLRSKLGMDGALDMGLAW